MSGQGNARLSVLAGVLTDYPGGDSTPESKGRVIIEWPLSPATCPANHVLPSVLTSVRDAETGALIPAAKITVHAGTDTFVTADIAVFLDRHGEIIHDPYQISRESDGIPATFPFLVAGMRNGAGRGEPS